jgi:hypothetical protein
LVHIRGEEVPRIAGEGTVEPHTVEGTAVVDIVVEGIEGDIVVVGIEEEEDMVEAGIVVLEGSIRLD